MIRDFKEGIYDISYQPVRIQSYPHLIPSKSGNWIRRLCPVNQSTIRTDLPHRRKRIPSHPSRRSPRPQLHLPSWRQMRSSQRSTGVNRTQFSLKLVLSCLFILALAWTGLSADLPSDDCEPKDCGDGLNISYPFWIEDRQSPSCGYPAFKLACKNSAAVLKIYDDDYLVHNIFYSNRSFIVSSLELVGSCPVPRYTFSLGGTQFSINPTNSNISFFLNCTELVSGYRIGCPGGGNRSGSYVGNYSSPEQESFEYGRKNCESFVVWPYREDVGAGGDGNYSALLDNGFLLDWDAVDCSACEASGGRCRYDLRWSRFACVCSDRSHAISCQGGNKRRKVAIGVGAGVGGFFLASFICLLLYRRKKMKARTGSSTLFFRTASSELSSKKDPEMGSSHYLTHLFEYEELHEATDGFNPSNELGDGGFGTVYKGKLRDGRIVAVKRLYENNWKRVEQFKNEVGILNRLRHQNLVTLYGCTSRHSRELLLVYEYIPNGTVADHLHGPRAPEGTLTWPIRLNIAVETATALAYLHAVEPQIIHRDVKTNNILLDNNFHVKVADFGLSRLFPTDVTHVSTAPQGTPGYVDPEYHQCYQLTDKSDVYSFGVVLVELISSMPAVDITRHRHEINLSNMAINKIQNDALHELVDPELGFETDWDARRMIKLVAELAFRCLQAEKEMRPSMEDVVEVLQGIQSHDQAAEREGDVDHGAKDDMSLLKSNVPPSPASVMDKWSSRTTTPNTSG